MTQLFDKHAKPSIQEILESGTFLVTGERDASHAWSARWTASAVTCGTCSVVIAATAAGSAGSASVM